jgi:ligand-binding sensor domain-containing protein/two-component sensor histidine kinase
MKRLLLAGLFYVCTSYGQQGYTFNRLSTDDANGLSSNNVNCTYQDSRGYIWVGTSNGLQRFDGNKFISFIHRSPFKKDLPVSDLSQILPAENGAMWLLFSEKQEVGIYNPFSFTYQTIRVSTSTPFAARSEMRLWKDRNNNIYLFIWKYGVLRYDPAKNSFGDDNSFRLPKGWIPYKHIYEDTVKNRIWIPCPDSGLAVYDINSGKTYTRNNNPLNLPLLQNKDIQTGVSEFYIDSKRRYWVFNWAGIHQKRCFDEQGRLLKDTAGINSNPEYSELRNFFETKDKVLWVFGRNGLFNYDDIHQRFYFYPPGNNSSTGIPYHHVNHMMEDRDGSIWFSTDNGLFFTVPGSGTTGVVNLLFDERNGGIEITDLLQLAGGQYWLSTWGRGIISLDKNFDTYPSGIYNAMPQMDTIKRVQYKQTWALYQHSDGKVWIGCQAGKYMIYDTLSRKTVFSEIKEAAGSTIRYITGSKNGDIWISTQRGHIIKFDGKQFTLLQQFNTIINKILIDKEGCLWLSTLNQGLICLGPDGRTIKKQFTSSAKENALFINSGEDIDQINDTTIAYGAGALNLVNTKTGQVRQLGFEEGLPGNSIQRIRADRDGNLWIITMNGLCKYNPRNNRFTPFGRKDGITLANLTKNADFISKEGLILFTGANALMYFEPALFENKLPPPNVVITDFKLFNEYMPVDSLLSLPKLNFAADQNSFTIYFSALSYRQKEKLTYYYKMSGIDKDWVKADRQNYVNYPLLPAGSYTFSVYCENIEGIRSPAVTQFSIYIKPPFWKTYWFGSTVLFLVLLLIYALHRTRVNRLLAVEKIRTRVARDLHDDMGSTLSTINILSTMAKSKLNTDTIKTSEYISKISENSQRMMEAMDDIVWSIKPMNDSMQKITARMREFATSVLEAKNIEVEFSIEEPVYDIKLHMEARRDLFLVYKEAINNAAKYSKAGKVTVTLTTQPNRLHLEVRDNGVGFNVTTADSGNGLGNMQKRAESMNGKLQLISSPGTGTRVLLTIPLQ